MSRPEHFAPPEIFYNDDEAKKYATSSRMIDIQTKMTERALELLLLPESPCLLLDIGCGSGISGETLTEAGHLWMGLDISRSMLDVAVDREVEGDVILGDMGHGLGFRSGTFDGAVSISAIQWLCNCDRKGQEPFNRMRAFFNGLYACLKKGARAALQFYPETAGQVEMMTAAALRCGFGGGVVVDFPHSTKAKKTFLVLYAGLTGELPARIPKGLEEEMEEDEQQTIAVGRRNKEMRKRIKGMGTKEFILMKKDQQRTQGREVRKDTKYTARSRRKPHF